MTQGVLCDSPGCGCFDPRPIGTWEHWTTNSETGKREAYVAHLCGDCAAKFSETLGFRPEGESDNTAA